MVRRAADEDVDMLGAAGGMDDGAHLALAGSMAAGLGLANKALPSSSLAAGESSALLCRRACVEYSASLACMRACTALNSPSKLTSERLSCTACVLQGTRRTSDGAPLLAPPPRACPLARLSWL